MDQEHKTGSQERDALLREILDDTSPNRHRSVRPFLMQRKKNPFRWFLTLRKTVHRFPMQHLHPLQSQQHHRLTHGMPTCQNPTGTLAAHRHFRLTQVESMLLR